MKPLLALQSSAKVVPCDEKKGTVQPIFALYVSICSRGILDTVAQLTSLSASSDRSTTLLVKWVQPGQNSSGPLSMN
jgi:hypothetical protein